MHMYVRTFSVLWFEAQNTSTVSDGVGVLLLLDAYECPVVEGSGRGAQSDAAGVVGQRLIMVAGFECLHGKATYVCMYMHVYGTDMYVHVCMYTTRCMASVCMSVHMYVCINIYVCVCSIYVCMGVFMYICTIIIHIICRLHAHMFIFCASMK